MSSYAKLSRWAADHHGVVDLDRLHRCGFSSEQVRHLCTTGQLVRARRGIYVVTSAPATELRRIRLACATTGGSAGAATAGKLWELRRVPDVPDVQMVIPFERDVRRSGLAGVQVRRTRDLARGDVVRRRDGISLTSPPRTLFDLAALVSAEDLESMIEQVIDRRMCTAPTLWATARRLARPGRRGSSRFVDVLSERPAWVKPAGSHDELVLAKRLVEAGLPIPVRQHPLRLAGGRVVHPDLAWPERRFAVEVDHVTWHGGRVESTYDKWRDRQVRLAGWEVERVTDRDIRCRPKSTVTDLVGLHAMRAWVSGDARAA